MDELALGAYPRRLDASAPVIALVMKMPLL